MARGKKKLEVQDNSGASEAFLNRLFKEGEVACIQPTFDNEYLIDGKMYTFTETVLDEMMGTGRVRVTHRTDKLVNLMGVLI